METSILIWCVATPAILSLAFVVLAIWLQRHAHAFVRDRVSVGVAVLGWCVAVAAVLIARQELDWSALEAWQAVLFPIAVTGIVVAMWRGEVEPNDAVESTVRVHDDGSRWVFAAIGCMVTAMIAMPHGDGWADVLPSHRTWMTAVGVASLSNMWSLDRLARDGGRSWVLWIAVAGLGGPTILAATAYGGLAEWQLGGLMATASFAVLAIWKARSVAWSAVYPATMLVASGTAAGRFYSYEDHPVWLHGVLLFGPTLMTLPDWFVRHRSTRVRVGVAACFAVVLIVIVGWTLVGESLMQPPDAESW